LSEKKKGYKNQTGSALRVAGERDWKGMARFNLSRKERKGEGRRVRIILAARKSKRQPV